MNKQSAYTDKHMALLMYVIIIIIICIYTCRVQHPVYALASLVQIYSFLTVQYLLGEQWSNGQICNIFKTILWGLIFPLRVASHFYRL